MAKKTVFLIGYMGIGKTTLGGAVSRLMGRPFIDLDEYVEAREGMTVREIFARHGVDYFRRAESAALREVAAHPDGAIVACGGGTPCVSGNMQLMNAEGVTVWLTTSAERITSRLVLPEQKVKRPLIADLTDAEILDFVSGQMAQREPYYSQAQYRFDATWLDDAEQVAETSALMKRLIEDIENQL